MARPKAGYEIEVDKVRVKVPGVTTVLSRFKESGALMYWAWQQGKEGKDFRETKQAAADAGLLAHDMVEHDIYGQKFEMNGYSQDAIAAANGAFTAYKEWKAQTQLQIAEAEMPLVSNVYAFGGTLDAIFVQGKLALGDWKTSGGIYADYLLQLAAYSLLWEENFPDRPLEGGFHLLRFSKQETPADPISFSHHYWSQLDVAKDQFLYLLAAYRLDKRVKGLL